MNDAITQWDVLAITVLLPIAAVMTVLQKNPYHALVVRGILGGIAALVYALFGAADVALTEALVGTMLAITLYAVAVRSSLELRLGIVGQPEDLHEEDLEEGIAGNWDEVDAAERKTRTVPRSLVDPILRSVNTEDDPPEFEPLLQELRGFCGKHYLRLELFFFPDRHALDQALAAREVHAVATAFFAGQSTAETGSKDSDRPYGLTVRVERLHELMQQELNPAIATLRPAEIGALPPKDLAPASDSKNPPSPTGTPNP